MTRPAAVGALVICAWFCGLPPAGLASQTPPTPLPFPKAAPPPASTQKTPPATAAPKATTGQPTDAPQGAVPTAASLGLPFYPTLQFIASYDAGRGQRYFLFGTTASFADVVNYYKSVLKQRGELVFDAPAVHMFDVGRFREDTMAFPPSITVKDYTWGSAKGYLVPGPGAASVRYPTVVQIVPIPAAPPQSRR